MSTDAGYFQVHLQSLEQFGQELQSQLDALRRPVDRLVTLSGQQLPLGDFGEAHALSARHLVAAQQMTGLVQAVASAVAFAGDVTRTVAASYQRFDQQAAAGYGAPAAGTAGAATTPAATTPAAGTAAAPAAAGPTPTAVQVSVPVPATITVAGPSLPTGLPVSVTEAPAPLPIQSVQYADPSQAPVVS